MLAELEATGRRIATALRRVRQTPSSAAPSTTPTATPKESDVPTDSPAIQVLASLDELKGKLEEIDAAWAVSDDAMREVFQGFTMAPPTDIPDDPYSQEYADRQFEIYRLIAERATYEVENERCDFPTDANRPFPYYTESAETVGHQLIAMGFIIKSMGLPAGATVLELGPGWGNTTIELARMGYQVTAIDIDPAFVELIQERAQKFSLEVDARRGTFLEIDQLGQRYDAVLFYECFHHCSDHRLLVKKLADVLKPGGKVFFASEPILDSFPMPWGVRTDGESLWAIRRNGWLELGFQESYFVRMLSRLGWVTKRHFTDATHLGVVFEAKRAEGFYELGTFILPPDEDATWSEPNGTGPKARRTSGSSTMSVESGGGFNLIEIAATNPFPFALEYRVSHGLQAVSGTADPFETIVIRCPYDPAGEALTVAVSEGNVPATDLGGPVGLDIRSVTLTGPT
jgi:2-polyprenyl-3-methyl-5-hydroxy-6-metoxy-1,4-benzoquinol methylase